MRNVPRAEPIVVFTLALTLIAGIVPSRATAHVRSAPQSWAAIGVGLAPAPYGLDGNGSPVCDLTFGKSIRERISLVTSIAHIELFGYTPARFTPVFAGVRAHLSNQNVAEGGPYLVLGPTICYARFRDQGVSQTRLLPGIEFGVGTIMQLSEALALDWSASHVVTTDAGGFTPHPLTRETKRDGLDRGTVRIRLVLRR